MPLNTILTNLVPVGVTTQTLEGREYLSVPTAMLAPGVWPGSQGPIRYEASELQKYPGVWDHKPIVVYHPQINGEGVSACKPEVLDAQKIGIILQSHFDGKLRCNAWIDIEKANRVDDRIIDAIENSKTLEVSTGLFSDYQMESGVVNGKEYCATAINLKPDHLAILPDKVGAYAVADGAGLLQLNELSHSNVRAALRAAILARFGEDTFIEDVYGSFFVYEVFSKTNRGSFRLPYSTTDNNVTVLPTDTPVEVIRVTEWRTKDTGAFVGNMDMLTHLLAGLPHGVKAASVSSPSPQRITEGAREGVLQNGGEPGILPSSATIPGVELSATPVSTEGGVDVNRQTLVTQMIANASSCWTEADRAFLMGVDDVQFKKLSLNGVAAQPSGSSAPVAPDTPGTVTPTANAQSAIALAVQTVDQFLATAPPEIAAVLNNGLASLATERQRLTSTITANGQNPFTEEELGRMSMPSLTKLAAFARPQPMLTQPGDPLGITNYGGAAGVAPQSGSTSNQGDGAREPFVAPTMDYSTDK